MLCLDGRNVRALRRKLYISNRHKPSSFQLFLEHFFNLSEVKLGYIRLSLHTPLKEESYSYNKSHTTDKLFTRQQIKMFCGYCVC